MQVLWATEQGENRSHQVSLVLLSLVLCSHREGPYVCARSALPVDTPPTTAARKYQESSWSCGIQAGVGSGDQHFVCLGLSWS